MTDPTGIKPKKKYKKGTAGLRLDWVRPPMALRYATDDPKISKYAHQMTAIPRKANHTYKEALLDFCAMTKTLPPVPLAIPDIKSQALLDGFIQHIAQSHSLYKNTLDIKGFNVQDNRSPVEVEAGLKHYSGHFLQNILIFLSKCCLGDDRLHLTHDQYTAAHWKLQGIQYPFQLMQHVDLILRTDTPIIHRSLLPSPTDMESRLDHRIHHAHKRRELFTENREVKSYPGYVKDSIHPYNHTVFKVVAPNTHSDSMPAINMMTGFAQTFATANHRAEFPVRVDKVPELKQPEAVNVVISNTKTFCVGTYQLNSTNLHGYQDNETYNMCTVDEPRSLLQEDGRVEPVLASHLLTLLTQHCYTAQQDQKLQLGDPGFWDGEETLRPK